jgi:hypothetical protein
MAGHVFPRQAIPVRMHPGLMPHVAHRGQVMASASDVIGVRACTHGRQAPGPPFVPLQVMRNHPQTAGQYIDHHMTPHNSFA